MFSSLISKIKRRWAGNCGYGEVLRVGLPLVISMASVTIMLFTDRLFLSHYSLEAIAAALPAGLAHLTLILTLSGLCSYSSIFIAQYVGAKQKDKVGLSLWQGIWLCLFCSIIPIIGYFLAEPIFKLVGHDPEVRRLEVEYFAILCLGSLPFLLSSVLGGFYAGQGLTRPVLWANTLAALVNIPLDYVLIFGAWGFPELGIAGAAVATVAGAAVGVIFLACLIFRAKNEELFKVRSNYHLDPALLKKILRYGVPSGINMFLELFSVTWFVFVIGQIGPVQLAATNIAFSINSIIFTPMLGLNMAVAALVGQSMGRGNTGEAEFATENTLHLAFVYMLPLALLLVLAPDFLLDLFKPGNLSQDNFAAIKEPGRVLLAFIALYSLVDACNLVYFGALKGAGDTMFFMILMGGAGLSLVLGMELVKIAGYANLTVYWSIFTAYVILLAALARRRYIGKKWHHIRLIEETIN